MKRDTSKILFAIVVFVALGLLVLNPAFAVADCDLVCTGSYVINDADDLAALSGCASVTGSIWIANTSLTSLEGLECLTHVDQILLIENNDSLTSLVGLGNLESLGRGLWIKYNDSLTRLRLKNLESVGMSLSIEDNDSLTRLRLKNLESVGMDFGIKDNNNLCTSLAIALADQVTIGGLTDIFGNKDCTP